YNISGCVFNGTMTTSGKYDAGGLTGWGGASSNSATITDCLFAGTYVGSAKFHPVGCFDGNTRAISNMYYTQAPSGGMTDGETHSFVKTTTYKGERVYSVTAGTGVTITPLGTPVTSYNVSKLDLYETDGIAFNGVRYGDQGDVISMNLSGAPNYTATTGTLSGSANPYSLTLAAANSVINFVPVASVTVGETTTNYPTFAEAVSAWENNSTLTLLANVEYGSTITVNNTRTLDLNGYGIKRTGTGRVFYINGSGNLTINDSNPDSEHKFTVTNAYGDAGLATLDEASGSLTVNGGYITGGNGENEGGAIYVDGHLTINGGNIIGNRANSHGGAIKAQNANASVTMNGGRICYNTFAYQGALTIGNSTLRLYGGEVSHNRSFGNGRWHTGGVDICGGTFYLHGAPIITGNYGGNEGNTNQPNDICLEQKVTIDGEMTNTTPIGIMMNLGGYNGQTRGQFSIESASITNETVAKFTPQNYPNDEIVRIGNALWVWNSVLDTQGSVFYQVTYDSRGGSDVTGQKVLAGTTAAQPTNPTKAGCTFDAWYKDALLTDAWNFASDVVTAAVTLHARYAEDVAFPISITATTTDAKGGWYLISSPIGAVNPSSVNNMTSNDYDLFRFNQNPPQNGSGNYLEWENWNEPNSGSINHNHFNLEPGRGYLYANDHNVELTFVGTPYSGSGQVTLVRSNSNGNTDGRMLGWNLIGNPFGVTATINKDYYRMNNTTHAEVVPCESTVSIDPMEGVFVYAANNEETVTFTKGASKRGESNENNIVINLSDNKGTIIDRAIVSFDKDHTLPKFQIRNNSTKLYIPQNGVDYAIAFAYRVGELPLNFKAQETGVYTLSFNGENMTGVSLVDMIEGAVIDLSVNDTYTFIGTPNDRENRFKLVFSSPNDSNIDIFAYQSDNDIVVSGDGELQVFDVTGRMVMTKHVNGVQTMCMSSLPTGVYIFRLNEKAQKIVVR
ncbi:MAG: InlB B-repeat-containing protein, partial [Bacteroidales bacterium]|nr:InlB B-repeat-containing protein [Bacteroidales bacterium]